MTVKFDDPSTWPIAMLSEQRTLALSQIEHFPSNMTEESSDDRAQRYDLRQRIRMYENLIQQKIREEHRT